MGTQGQGPSPRMIWGYFTHQRRMILSWLLYSLRPTIPSCLPVTANIKSKACCWVRGIQKLHIEAPNVLRGTAGHPALHQWTLDLPDRREHTGLRAFCKLYAPIQCFKTTNGNDSQKWLLANNQHLRKNRAEGTYLSSLSLQGATDPIWPVTPDSGKGTNAPVHRDEIFPYF